MKKKILLRTARTAVSVFTLALAVGAQPGKADLLTIGINATFTGCIISTTCRDTETFSGSFVLNPSTEAISDIAISLSGPKPGFFSTLSPDFPPTVDSTPTELSFGIPGDTIVLDFPSLAGLGSEGNITRGTWICLGCKESFVSLTSGTYAASPTPEPGSLLLLGTGLVGIGAWGRRFLSWADGFLTSDGESAALQA